MARDKVVDINNLLILNEGFAHALRKGEKWAIKHMRLCESLNGGEAEGFRRPFDGTCRKWCGEACPHDEGCMMCALPENPEIARFNRTHPDVIARFNQSPQAEKQAKQGIITLAGRVDSSMERQLGLMLKVAKIENVEILHIEIESDGGDISSGLKICGMIRDAKVKQRIGIVREKARSIAFIILQACDERVATPNARLLLHSTRFSNISREDLENPRRVKKLLKSASLEEQLIQEMMMRRSRRSKEDIISLSEQDTDITSAEALELGFIDGILQ